MPSRPRAAETVLERFERMLDEAVKADAEQFWEKIAGAELWASCEGDPDRIVNSILCSDLSKRPDLDQRIRPYLGTLCPADELLRMDRLLEGMLEYWGSAYTDTMTDRSSHNDKADWQLDIRRRLERWQSEPDLLASTDKQPLGGTFVRGVVSQISVDSLGRDSQEVVRSQLEAFWRRWGDPDRARRCASLSDEQVSLAARLYRAHNLLKSGGVTFGVHGSFDPLRIDEITQDDLDDLATARLAGRRHHKAVWRTRQNAPRWTEWYQEKADDYRGFERMVLAINRAPESFAKDPGPEAGRCVSALVSRAGFESVRRRFQTTELAGDYRLIYGENDKGTTALLGYRIEAEHEGEPIAVQAVLKLSRTTRAWTPSGLEKAFRAELEDLGLTRDQAASALSEAVKLRWGHPLQPIEHGKLAAPKRRSAPDLGLRDICRHRNAHFGTALDPDTARLFCHDCGESMLAAIAAHRIPADMPNDLHRLRPSARDLDTYNDREKAYSLLLDLPYPPAGLHGRELFQWFRDRDGEISHDPQDLVAELIGPVPEPVRNRPASSVAQAMRRR